MDRFNTNRKRPAPTYNDFNASKRLQQSQSKSSNHDSLFISDDEGEAQVDEELFGRDNDNDFTSLVNSLRPQSVRPAQSQPQPQSQSQSQSQPTQPRPTQQRPPAQQRPATQPTSTPTTNGASTNGANTSISTSANAATVPPPTTIDLDQLDTDTSIKDEADQISEPPWLKDTPPTEKVTLFIGRLNRTALVRRTDLAKSPILTSWIIDDPSQTSGGQGAYIMRPQLAKCSYADFDAVLQFFHSGEYAPMLVDDCLDGVVGEEGYAKELLRGGRVYIIARMFEVQGLAELVYRKIERVDVGRYSIKAIVELAGIIFDNKRVPTPAVSIPAAAAGAAAVNRANENGTDGADGANNGDAGAEQPGRDKLEEWIITQVAKNFQEIMSTQQDVFWRVERKTRERMFFARVLEEASSQYRATGGRLAGAVVTID
ncbi:hypothetical protein PMZ80_007644 [Knufia obscura]|uniref:BTB domain-containing protein n=1 Tax=Knufia obscura TaxID=1635080 RepID=A0ABR0RJD3_9EURO|nr:hypothetical protein PMZ80_007644 [Knufia obscura]